MDIPSDIADQIATSLIRAKKILIISHRNPDPDTIGSNLALKLALKKYNKDVTSFCADELPKNCACAALCKEFVSDADPEAFDLFISVDAGSVEQAAFPLMYPAVLNGEKPFINIDHHPSNRLFGTINLVDAHAPATTAILYELFRVWKEPLTPEIATHLLYGLYFDTGSFMHSNTSERVMDIAADLMQKGADHQKITKILFKSKTVEQLKLWGKVLSSIEITDNQVVVGAVTQEDFNRYKAEKGDLSGVIDYLSSIPDTKFATLLSQEEDNHVRGSLRTRREDINVSEIAKNLGGGGHIKASGFSLEGKLQLEQRWSVTPDKKGCSNDGTI